MKIRRLQRFKKAYQKLPPDIQKKIDKALILFFSNVRHPSLQARKLESRPFVWYIRIDRNYRLTFEIDDEGFYVLRNVGPHDPTLKNP